MKHNFTVLFISFLILVIPGARAQLQTGMPSHHARLSLLSDAWKAQHRISSTNRTVAGKGASTTPRLSANYDATGTSAGSFANQDSGTYRYTTPMHLGFDLTGNVPQVTASGLILIGDFDTATNYDWHTSSSTYTPGFRIVNTYDGQDRPLRQFFQSWLSSAWVDFSRYTNYYNTAGNDTGSLNETWSSTTTSWTPSDRTFYVYDAAGNVINETNQIYDIPTSTWKNENHDSFTYDGNHNETYQLQQNWSAFHNSWYNYAQAAFTYNAAGNEQDVASQYYDTLTSAWNNDYHAHFYYNPSGQVIAETSQNGSGLTWVNSDSTSYTLLNAAGQPLNSLSFAWTSGAWVATYRTTTTSGGSGLPLVAVTEQWNGTAFVNTYRSTSFYNSFNKPTSIYTEHWNGSAWIVNASDQTKRYYYDLISTGVGTVTAPGAGIEAYVYPVPASQELSLAVHMSRPELCTGIICDILGRQVMQWTDKPEEFYTRNISVASLPAGHYYLRLQGKTVRWATAFEVSH